MARGTYRRIMFVGTILIGVLAVAGTLHAEEAGGGGMSTNVFTRFFWSKDPLGLIIIWALILTSVVDVALIITHTLGARRAVILPEDLALTVEQLLQEKKYREAIELTATDNSVFGKVIHEALGQASYGYAAMAQAVEDTASLLSAERVRAIEPLNILGAVGPMAGLFGTVYGMISSFYTIASMSSQPKPAQLAGGISTALVCTFWGLVVAVPAVIAYGVIRVKIEGLSDSAMGRASRLIAPFRPATTRRPAGSAATPVPV